MLYFYRQSNAKLEHRSYNNLSYATSTDYHVMSQREAEVFITGNRPILNCTVDHCMHGSAMQVVIGHIAFKGEMANFDLSYLRHRLPDQHQNLHG
jgi:hypothetical protein